VEFTIIPGSAVLQAGFYGMAAVIVVAASLLVKRVRFTVAAVAWVAGVSAASYAGLFMPRGGPPVFALLVVAVIVLGITLARSKSGDTLSRLPLAVLVGFQGFRLPLELLMHRAYREGLMPVQMSYSGRNFDIVTGATALILAIALALGRVPKRLVQAWNVMGVLLLANIVGVAILSTPAFAYFGPDRLNVWVMWMPYTLLPAVMVLAAWAGHLIVFRALR
jgi:hypothetical protein